METPANPTEEASKKAIREENYADENGNNSVMKLDIKPDPTVEPPANAAEPPLKNAVEVSKKRAREDEGGSEVQGDAKKIDTKVS